MPSQFAEDDIQRLHDFIESHSFATVITTDEAEPNASHLPLLLDRSVGKHGGIPDESGVAVTPVGDGDE